MKRSHKYFNLRSLRRTRRGILTTVGVMVGVLLLALLFTYEKIINYYAYDLLGQTLKRTVEIQTDGFYSISYDSIAVDFFRSKATLYDFNVMMDSAQLDQSDSSRTLFAAHVPKLEAGIINLIEVVFRDKVKIKSILMQQPEVWIARPKSGPGRPGFSKESGDIYKIVTEQIREFNLGSFGLEEARINYKRDVHARDYNLVLNDISFLIENFGWNKDEDTEERFHSDHISLTVKDQSFELRDSLHMVSFDSVYLSTEKEVVELINVNVYPRNEMMRQPEAHTKNAYSLRVPRLSMEQVDFTKAYLDNMLAIGRIRVQSPAFAMDNIKAAEKNREITPSKLELINIIARLFNLIEVENLTVDGGDVNILRARAPATSRFRASNIFAHVSNVKIDTLAYSEIHYDSATVGLKDYYYSMPDSIHVMKLGSVSFITTDRSNINIDSLKIYDKLSPKDRSKYGGVINLETPHIKISGFEFENFIENNNMVMKSISVEDPHLTFYAGVAQKDTVTRDISEIVSSVFNYLHADSLYFTNGYANIRRQGRQLMDVRGVNASVGELVNGKGRSNLYLDSLALNVQVQYLDVMPKGDIKGHFADISVKQADNASIFVKQVKLTGQQHTMLDFTMDNVRLPISGMSDLVHAQKNIIGGFSAEQFRLEYDKGRSKKQPPSGEVFSLQDIKLGKGEIRITDNRRPYLRTTVKKLSFQRLDLGPEPKVKGLELAMKNTIIQGEKAPINMANIVISDKKDLFALGKFARDGDEEILIDSVYAKGIDIDKILAGKSLNAREVVLKSPVMNLRGEKKPAKSKPLNFEDIRQQINKVIPEVNVKRLIVTDGKVSDHSQFEMLGIQADIRNLGVSAGKKWNHKIPFVQSLYAEVSQIAADNPKASIELKNVVIDSRSDAMNMTKLSYTKKDGTLSIDVPGVHMNIPDIYAITDHRELSIARLELHKPIFKITQPKDTYASKNTLESSELKAINIGSLSMADGHFKVHRANKEDLDMKRVSVTARGVSIDKKTNLGNDLIIFKALKASIPDLSFKSKDNLSTFRVGNLTFDSADSSITAQNLKLVPLEKDRYFRASKYETDWINASINRVKLSGIDLDKMFNRNYIDSRMLLIDGVSLEVYRDKNMKDAPPKEKQMFHTMLKHYDKPINISKVAVRNTKIRYTEFAEDAMQPGTILFDDFSADMRNVTNMPRLLNKNKNMTLDASTLINGQAPLNLSMSFDMKAKDGSFTVGGKLGVTPLTVFNDMTIHNANIEVREGTCNSLLFNIKADDKVAYGNMEFRYEDLKVFMLKDPSKKGSGSEKSLLSFFANTFVINKNNPHLFRFREGKIYFDRNPNKSIFNYWTKAFLSGIVASIGVNNNKKEFERAINEDDQ